MIWQSLIAHKYSKGYLRRKLAAIEVFYKFSEEAHPRASVDEILIDIRIETIESRLKSFLAFLQNRQSITGFDQSRTWKTVLDFTTSILDFLAQLGARKAPSSMISNIRHLERMYAFLRPARKVRPYKLRSLPSPVVEELCDLASPGNERNPFRNSKAQKRNFAIFLLLLHQGLRMGELLTLRTDAVNQEYDPNKKVDRYWLNVIPPNIHDVRMRPPSLKNQGSVRQLPLSENVATILLDYAINWRGRCSHGFLFESRNHRPLSLRAVGYTIERLGENLSDSSKHLLKDSYGKTSLSLHDFRHTCAIIRLRGFLDRGIEMNEAEMLLRAFFGWSRNSSMPRLYAKAYYDERLQTVWDNEFDSRTEILRSSDKTGNQ